MLDLIELIKGIQVLPDPVEQEPNFFTIGGSGYLENPTSELLAIFMGGREGNTPTWLAKALVYCLADRGYFPHEDLAACKWDNFFVEREAVINDEQTDTFKRLDLLVTSSSFVLGIEHKVYGNAKNNPFEVYDQLLQSRADGMAVLKCVLRPSQCAKDVHGDWPVVSYDELLAKAKLFYAADVAFSPISKWQFFYTEFLKHLHALAHPESDNHMDQQSFDFVMQHFIVLRKGQALLEDFEKQLLHNGETIVSKALQELGVDTTIRTRVHTWAHSKALRFRPDCWGVDSDIVLAYYEHEGNSELSVGFYLRAYIRRGTEKVDLETIREELIRVTEQKLDLWENDEDSEYCWWEQGKKILCFGVYAKDKTLVGSLKTLASLTKWLQRNAFTTAEMT